MFKDAIIFYICCQIYQQNFSFKFLGPYNVGNLII